MAATSLLRQRRPEKQASVPDEVSGCPTIVAHLFSSFFSKRRRGVKLCRAHELGAPRRAHASISRKSPMVHSQTILRIPRRGRLRNTTPRRVD